MMILSSRLERKKYERKQLKEERKQTIKSRVTDWIEEFKLNRQGKTKKRRTDVMARYRRTDQILTATIIIVGLLLLITWVIILFY